MATLAIRLLGLLLLCGLSSTASALIAVPTEPTAYITWEGICLDCLVGPNGEEAGTGTPTGSPSTATAILGVGVLGNAVNGHTDLSAGNLLTFSYTSALLNLTSTHVNDVVTEGIISDVLNSFAVSDVGVLFRTGPTNDDVYTFRSLVSDGDWSLRQGNEYEMDVGTNGRFNVPAPATLALFGLGLTGLGWSKRRKV